MRGKIKAYGLVRDKYGRPKVDNLDTLPEEIKHALTDEDIEYLRCRNGSNTSDNS